MVHLNELNEEAWKRLSYHPQQAQALAAQERFVNLACGRGSGKTEISRRRIVSYLPVRKPWSDPLYFFGLPTYGQAARVAWDPILKLVPRSWIKDASISKLMIETVFGSKLYIVGLDKPSRVEGVQWDGCVIDESCDVRPGTFAKSIVPALEHRQGWCWRIGVPKRQGIGAAEFKEFWDKGLKGTPGIRSFQWPSGDILTPAQLAWARENLDPQDFNEQYNAVWETIGGLVFHQFDEVLNVSDQVSYNPARPIVVSSDFNVDPMAWVIGHRYDNGLHIFDELYLRNTNTQRTLDALAERYGEHKAGWEFYGDATGQARKTSADASDYIQIRNDKRFERASIHYPKANPSVARRFASCNALLCNTEKKRRLKIHPRCRNLIHDLKYRAYKEGSREVDDQGGKIGHISDALGYVVYRRFPVKVRPHQLPTVSIQTS